MREAIRAALMQVKFSENQTLPQLNWVRSSASTRPRDCKCFGRSAISRQIRAAPARLTP